ncbi:MAG: HlyD family secretion protein [Vampirovibrionia bacterium]
MKKIALIVIFLIVLIVVLVGRWQLDVGSECTIQPDIEESKVLYAQTPGVLKNFRYRSGDIVQKDEVLGELINIELQDNIEQINAAMLETQAQQSVLSKQMDQKMQEVVSSRLQKMKVQSEYNVAAREYKGYKKGDLPPEIEILKLAQDEAKRKYDKYSEEQEKMNKQGIFPPSIESTFQKLEQAKIQLENSQFTFEKNKYLVSVGAVSKFDYENAKAQFEMNEKVVKNYEATLEEAKIKHYYDTLLAKDNYMKAKEEYDIQYKTFILNFDKLNYDTRIAGSQVDQSLSNYATATAQKYENDEKLNALKQKQMIYENKKGKLTLKSPAAGVLIEDNITDKVGKHFDLGEKICEVAGLDKVLVTVLVDEKDIGDVKVDYPVRLKVKPFMGSLFQGQVKKISPVSRYNEATKRNFYTVELVIENPEGKLKPGMTGFSKINCGSRPISSLLARELGHLVRSEYWFF